MRNLKTRRETHSKAKTRTYPETNVILSAVFALAVGALLVVLPLSYAMISAQAAEETVYIGEELEERREAEALSAQPDSLALAANITNQYAVTVKCDGETRTVFTPAITVAELLGEMDITLEEYDRTSMALTDTICQDGTQLKVYRAQYSWTSETVELGYETLRVEDPTMELGVEVVTQEGAVGQQVNTYQVIQAEGEEPVYQLFGSAVTSAATPEIITYGTYEPNTIVTASGEKLHYSKVLTCTATAYTDHSGNLTSTGTTPRVGAIAVDPTVIPYGTRMYIVTSDGSVIYGYATAEDCGGAIKGNRVDLYYNTESECVQFGRRSVEVYILD